MTVLKPVATAAADFTSLVGELDVSYAELVEVYGEPNAKADMYKTDAEWLLQAPDGTVATIYNYKSGRSYLGNEGDAVEDIRDWHVGGVSHRAFELVQADLFE